MSRKLNLLVVFENYLKNDFEDFMEIRINGDDVEYKNLLK